MKRKKPSKATKRTARKPVQPVIRKLHYDSPAVIKAKALIDRITSA